MGKKKTNQRSKRAEESHYWGMLWVNCVPTLLTSMLSKRHRFHPLIMPTPALTDRICTNESQRLRKEELIHSASRGFKLMVKMAHFQFWDHWHPPVILFKWVTEFQLVWHIVPYAPNTNTIKIIEWAQYWSGYFLKKGDFGGIWFAGLSMDCGSKLLCPGHLQIVFHFTGQ